MTKIISVVLSVIFGVLVISLVANAVTTISTNLDTDGTLTVDGHSTLTSASSTVTSQTGNFMVNGYATTTATNGNIATNGTLAVTSTTVLTGDVTMSGGNDGLIITTTNTATSSIDVGCIQMYATSTETAVHLTFATAALATTTTQIGTGDTDGTYGGVVVWRFGACPI